MTMKQLKKLIDVKSIVTLTLVFTLVFTVISGRNMNEDVFLLFSNIVTMVMTYFFTKRSAKGEEDVK